MSATIGLRRSAYPSSSSSTSRISTARRLYTFTSSWFFCSSAPVTFCSRIFSSYRSWTRMPTRFILSAYVGPMPRPVVPILRLPRNRSVTLSSVRLYGGMTWALALTTSFDVSTPRACKASSSSKRTLRSTTTPLPITGVTPGVRMPLGSRCSAYFSDPITTVWPALLPPLNLTT